MIKHKYEASGIVIPRNCYFIGTCVTDDIIKAIQLFRESGYSVWKIEKKEQVNSKEKTGIKSINMLGVYSAVGKSHTTNDLQEELYSELVKELGVGMDRSKRIRKVLGKVFENEVDD